MPTTNDNCKEWKKNPLKNPFTGRSIKENGPVFKKLRKICDAQDAPRQIPQSNVLVYDKAIIDSCPQTIKEKLKLVEGDIFKTCTMSWFWVIFGCYKQIVYDSKLRENTMSQRFTIFEGIRKNGNKDKIIAKMTYTDLVLDNVNGAIINKCAELEPCIKQHFSEYIDASWVLRTHTSFVLPNMIDACKVVATNQTELNRVGMHASFSRCLLNPYCVLDVINSKMLTPEKVAKKIGELFAAIRMIGREFGFVHNDAHLGNVLYDASTQKMVLINYGQHAFFWKLDKIKNHVDDIVKFEASKYFLNERWVKHQDIHSIYHAKLSTIETWIYSQQFESSNRCDLHVFDIMTISMGIIEALQRDEVLTHLIQIDKDHINIPVVTKIEEDLEKPSEFNSLKVGILVFAHCIIAINFINSDPKNKRKKVSTVARNTIKVNRRLLRDYINTKWQIDYMFDERYFNMFFGFTDVDAIVGRFIPKITTSRGKMQSTSTQPKDVNSNYFEQEIKAYAGDESNS